MRCGSRPRPGAAARCLTPLLAGDAFDAAVGELAGALMLDDEPAELDPLERAIDPAVLEQGWYSAGVPPSVHAVGGAIERIFIRLEALDLVTSSRRSGLELTPAGHVAPRARALGQRNRLSGS